MSQCKCGATVTFVQAEVERLPLETFGTTMGERWVVTDFTTEPWTAIKLDPTSPVEGHPDHRVACPFTQ